MGSARTVEGWAFVNRKKPAPIRDIRIELGIIPPPEGYDGPLPTQPWKGDKHCSGIPCGKSDDCPCD